MRMAHEAVLDHVQQALTLLDKTPRATGTRLLRMRLLEEREATLDVLGDRVGQRADIDALAELAEAQDDNRRRAHEYRDNADVRQRVQYEHEPRADGSDEDAGDRGSDSPRHIDRDAV